MAVFKNLDIFSSKKQSYKVIKNIFDHILIIRRNTFGYIRPFMVSYIPAWTDMNLLLSVLSNKKTAPFFFMDWIYCCMINENMNTVFIFIAGFNLLSSIIIRRDNSPFLFPLNTNNNFNNCKKRHLNFF